MYLIAKFKTYLNSLAVPPSPLTTKNYLSDIRKFINWFEQTFARPFLPGDMTPEIIEMYKKFLVTNKLTSPLSQKRYIASLRKFSHALVTLGLLKINAFASVAKDIPTDPWSMQEFTNFLKYSNLSDHTVKNYIIDVSQFLEWLEQVTNAINPLTTTQKVQLHINEAIIEEYKGRLFYDAKLSPVSINRKLSSLRKYITWGTTNGKFTDAIIISRFSQNDALLLQQPHDDYHSNTPTDNNTQLYSSFPPLRLLQKTGKGFSWLLDTSIIYPLVAVNKHAHMAWWKITGRKLMDDPPRSETSFTSYPLNSLFHIDEKTGLTGLQKGSNNMTFVPNITKSMYAPLSKSVKNLPFHKKLAHYAYHKRPEWYKRYHQNTITHYIHFALLMVAVTGGGVIVASEYVARPMQQVAGIKTQANIGSFLSYQGKLLNGQNNPVIEKSQLRFGLYTSMNASGSALIWEEVQEVTPHSDGTFVATLGTQKTLPTQLLKDNPELYVGITLEANPEFIPRQAIANVMLAANSETLQGMLPITDIENPISNAILALNSAGNLNIGGSASPTFQATGGIFTLSGTGLNLITNPGTDSNIVINPDGVGIIDIQKPLQNTSELLLNGSGISAVAIHDTLAILASDSAQPALMITQTASGDILSASSSGSTKFSISNIGSGFFAEDIKANGTLGLLLTGPNAGIQFLGQGIHTLGASNGTLYISAFTTAGNISLGKDTHLLPELEDGTNNLGSEKLQWDNLYVKDIYVNGKKTINTWEHHTNNSLTPLNISDSINTGSSDINSAIVHLAGTTSDNSFVRTGNFGIGTTNPNFRLSIEDMKPDSGIMHIYNSSTGANADGLTIQLGFSASGSATNRFIAFQNGQGVLKGAITANPAGGIAYETPAADFAEYFEKQSGIAFTPGDIVITSENGVMYASNAYETSMIGVVSESPGFVGGTNGPDKVLVGLNGQIPVKVSASSRPIKKGDVLTSSTEARKAMKALIPGPILGRALEDWNPGSGKETVLAYIHPTWHDPFITLTDTGNLSIVLEDEKYIVHAANQTLIERIGAFSKGFIGRLEAGLIKTGELIVTGSVQIAGTLNTAFINASSVTTQSLHIASDNVSIAGKQLRTYIEEITDERITARQIVSPVQTSTLTTDVISPLASDSIVLNGKLVIKDEQNAQPNNIALSVQGNASVSGMLTSSALSTQTASVSGVLTAEAILTNDLSLSDQALAKLKEQLGATQSASVTNITNIYVATQTASIEASPSATPSPFTPDMPSEDTDSLSASLAASLTYTPNLAAEFATIANGLMSFGPTSLSDTSITGQLAIGGNFILTENSINVLGSDLELQPLKQGGLSIMGGLVAIDTEGNLDVKGKATFANDVTIKGMLTSGFISSVPDEDLIIKLPKSQSNQADRHDPALVIQDNSGTNMFSVTDKGDIQASGSGLFKHIAGKSLQIIRGVQADTSLTETVASSSAGGASITAHQTERTIISPFVTKDSLIYITTTNDTDGVIPYLARQTAAYEDSPGSFTIQIPHPVSYDIRVNWWIVN